MNCQRARALNQRTSCQSLGGAQEGPPETSSSQAGWPGVNAWREGGLSPSLYPTCSAWRPGCPELLCCASAGEDQTSSRRAAASLSIARSPIRKAPGSGEGYSIED